MLSFFDRNGREIGMWEWARLYEDRTYKRIAHDELENGIYISTVWLGFNHALTGGPLLIFETMVFPRRCTHKKPVEECDCWHEQDMERYSTEAQAVRGHRKMVLRWRTRAAEKGA